MPTALKIDLLGIPRAQSLLARIRENAAALEARHPDVSACNVTVEGRAPHAYQRKQFNVRLGLRLNERELVVNREHDTDPETALGDAFAAAVRQLSDLQRSGQSRR